MDASEYKSFNTNVVLYLYNPFHEPVMHKVLKNIEYVLVENNIHIIIVYLNPLSSLIFDKCKWLKNKNEINLPHDYSRKVQRKCFIYSNGVIT